MLDGGEEQQPTAEKRHPPVIKIALEAVLSDGSTSRFDVEQVCTHALCTAFLKMVSVQSLNSVATPHYAIELGCISYKIAGPSHILCVMKQ